MRKQGRLRYYPTRHLSPPNQEIYGLWIPLSTGAYSHAHPRHLSGMQRRLQRQRRKARLLQVLLRVLKVSSVKLLNFSASTTPGHQTARGIQFTFSYSVRWVSRAFALLRKTLYVAEKFSRLTVGGKAGKIYAHGEGFYLYCDPGSARAWGFVKKALAFCRVTHDGEDDGFLFLDRLPTPAEGELIRDKLVIRKRRVLTDAERERLALTGFRSKQADQQPGQAK